LGIISVVGVCNGFQVLCETGLLPGALLHNPTHNFLCKNIYLRPATNSSALTADLDTNRAYKIPIAHGEGRYYAPEDTIRELEENEQIIAYYCTENAEVTPEAGPNGSVKNIAGVMNKNKNVFGMMPHPERAADPDLGNTDGLPFFESLVKNMTVAS